MTKPRSDRPGGLGLADVASWVVASLLLCWSGIPAGPAAAAEPAGSTAPRLTGAAGTVEVRAAGADAWERAAVGRELQPGDAIRTGALSKAEVTHAAGTIRLFEQTVLRLPMRVDGGVKRVDRVEMLAGQSLFDVVPARLQDLVARVSAGARALLFEVVTPHIVAGVKGTRFAVAERGDRSVVAVYSGTVETSDRARTAGQTAVLGAWQRAEYADAHLAGVSRFEGTPGFESWSDLGIQVAPGLETATADPGTAASSEVAAADGGNRPAGNSPAGNGPAGNSPAGGGPPGNSPAGSAAGGRGGGKGGGAAASPQQ